MAAVVMVVCLRVGTIITMALAYSDAVTRSTRPWLSNVLFTVVIVESMWLMIWTVRHREYRSTRWVTVETSLATACLLLEPWYVPLDARVGTWVGWAPGFAVDVCICAAVGCRTRGQTALVAALISAAYVVVSLPAVGSGTTLGSVIGNAATYAVFAFTARTLVTSMRRLGDAADDARDEAVRAGRQVELERHRRLLHDPSNLLRYLADPNLDPLLAEAVRTQALAEANRIRAYLANPDDNATRNRDTGNTGGGTSLPDVVQTSMEGFTDLPMEPIVRLADEVRLEAGTATAVSAAVITVLHNVRRHAGPDASVILHADYDPAEEEWELTIRDDGVGFDPSSTQAGYGLSQIAGKRWRSSTSPGTFTVSRESEPLSRCAEDIPHDHRRAARRCSGRSRRR